jgi:hypothetical protein
VKFLLFEAIAVNVVASLYLALIAPIMVHGWNSTTFNTEAAAVVTVLLLIGICGSIVGLVWRNARPRGARWVTGVPAAIVILGCAWTMMD